MATQGTEVFAAYVLASFSGPGCFHLLLPGSLSQNTGKLEARCTSSHSVLVTAAIRAFLIALPAKTLTLPYECARPIR